MKYWLQTQAPAGNWVDSLGTDDLESALSHSDYLQDRGEKTRIVTRVDTPVKRPAKIKRNPLSAHAAAIMGAPLAPLRGTRRHRSTGAARPRRNPARRKVAKRSTGENFIELRNPAGKVLFRAAEKYTTIADLKSIAKMLRQRWGVAISAHRIKG